MISLDIDSHLHAYVYSFRHTQEINKYECIDYEVTYQLDYYNIIYKYNVCGHTETFEDVRYTELDRKRVGTHIEDVGGEISSRNRGY